MRTAIQWQSEELEERQSVLDKREMALDKSHQSEADRQLNTSNSELGARRKKDPTGEDKVPSTVNTIFLLGILASFKDFSRILRDSCGFFKDSSQILGILEDSSGFCGILQSCYGF